MSGSVLVVAAWDTKAVEHEFLCERLREEGCEVVRLDFGVLSEETAHADISAAEVAESGGATLETLRAANDRGQAMKTMAQGVAVQAAKWYGDGRADAVIGMGGSGGTSVITAAMRALPLGVPKVCVSTVAGSDTGPYVGTKDIVMIPSITDVAGLNRISRRVIAQAAGAVSGMLRAKIPAPADDRPLLAVSMFGNTTDCVEQCRGPLEAAGYELLVFHAVGSGGRTMEMLIDEGYVAGCLDITTTEWADQLCGGIFAAGEDRLAAPGRRRVPHLIVPGCIDMVNFGPLDTVPTHYREGRNLYPWNPAVTLMRTNVEENRRLGQIFAEKANAHPGPVAILLPLRGVSLLDGDGERFCDREADAVMFATLKQNLRSDIPVVEVDANINDALFAERAVETMLGLLAAGST